ncbi:hypothetical protein ACWCQS_13260 [Streptomyces sp. NPDC002076]
MHNHCIVPELQKRGTVIVDSEEEVPHGAIRAFSAYGVSRGVCSAATGRQLEVIDTTCPLVSKAGGPCTSTRRAARCAGPGQRRPGRRPARRALADRPSSGRDGQVSTASRAVAWVIAAAACSPARSVGSGGSSQRLGGERSQVDAVEQGHGREAAAHQ